MAKQATEIERLTKEVLHWQDVAAEEMSWRLNTRAENFLLRKRVGELLTLLDTKNAEIRFLRQQIDALWSTTTASIPDGMPKPTEGNG